MMSRYLAIGFGLLALSVPPQDTEVKGARVSVVRKPRAFLNVTIENRRDSPLVAWQIGLSEPGTSVGRMTHSADFSGRPVEAGLPNGPIPPHERRTVSIDLINPRVDSPVLQLAAFEDGRSEGIAAVVEPWRKARQARVDELRYWNGVFELMPRVSEPDLRAYLASRLEGRAGEPVQEAAGMRTVSGKLRDVLRQYPSGPDVWPPLDRLRAQIRTELALTSQPSVNTPAPPGPVTSAAILTQERVTSGTLVATIENLRTVPIEAYGLELLDPVTRRPRSGRGSDFCNTELSVESGTGPIKPGEIREIPLLIPAGPDEPLPPVRLSYVIFDDLLYEGAVAPREEALRRREERAADHAFAVSVLGQVGGRPASEVQTFLIERRAERARQLQTNGGREVLMLIDELIRQAKESPDRLLANAKVMQERFERQRQRLVRHLAR